METVQYRPLGAHEIGDAADLFEEAITDLVRRNGLPPTTLTRPALEALYTHLQATGIFHAAFVDGRITAICAAIVREDQWFLSMFWTRPSHQRRGVGGPLLRGVREEGRRRGATRALVWSSVDLTAMASYFRLGMLPGCEMLTFAGDAAQSPSPDATYQREPLDRATATAFDRAVRGVARDEDHAFLDRAGASAWQLRHAGEVIGYYRTTHGVVGPAAWHGAHGPALLTYAIATAREQAPTVRFGCAGSNHDAIRTALAAGLRLVSSAHVLCDRPFGALERYVPSGPGLF